MAWRNSTTKQQQWHAHRHAKTDDIKVDPWLAGDPWQASAEHKKGPHQASVAVVAQEGVIIASKEASAASTIMEAAAKGGATRTSMAALGSAMFRLLTQDKVLDGVKPECMMDSNRREACTKADELPREDVLGSNSPTIVLDGHAVDILQMAEAIRLRIGKVANKKCSTIHHACKVVHSSGEQHDKLLKQMNKLNSAYNGLRHFDADMLRQLWNEVDRFCQSYVDGSNTHEPLVSATTEAVASSGDFFSHNIDTITDLLESQVNDCRAVLAAQQARLDSRFAGIESAIASCSKAMKGNVEMLAAHQDQINSCCVEDTNETAHAQVQINTGDVVIHAFETESHDTSMGSEEEREQQEINELLSDPDYIEFLAGGGIHDESEDNDLEGFE